MIPPKKFLRLGRSGGGWNGPSAKDGQVAENFSEKRYYVNLKTSFQCKGTKTSGRGKLGGKCAKLCSVKRYRRWGKREYKRYFPRKSEKIRRRITGGKSGKKRPFCRPRSAGPEMEKRESAVPQALTGRKR